MLKSNTSELVMWSSLGLSKDTNELFTELYAKWTTQKISDPIRLIWLVCFLSNELKEVDNLPKSLLWWWNTFAVVMVK